jgi:hypothetical protein
MFEFESGTFLLLYICLCFMWRIALLVSWCASGRCGMVSSDEDRGRSRRPGAEDWGWSHRLGTQWSND